MGGNLSKEALLQPLPSGLRARLARASSSAAASDRDDDAFEELPPRAHFETHYILGKKLGQGSYAVVHQCKHKRTGRERAVKIIPLKKLCKEDLDAVEDEIAIMRQLHHRNIVRLYHVFRTDRHILLVQELCAGGELFDRIVAKSNYSEADARELMRRALEALAYAHGKGVVHRDLKPENILLASPTDDVELKLADFGMAKHLLGADSLRTICGSPGYMAPEIVKEEPYNEKVDIWSLGTIMFCLLGGFNPFEDRCMPLMLAKIKRGMLSFRHPVWSQVTVDARDLIRQMIVVCPRKRITAQAALQHRWFHISETKLGRHDLSLAKQGLKELRKNSRFRAAADAIILANRLKTLTSGESLSGRRSSSGSSSGSSSRGSSASTASLSLSSASCATGRDAEGGKASGVATAAGQPRRTGSITNVSSSCRSSSESLASLGPASPSGSSSVESSVHDGQAWAALSSTSTTTTTPAAAAAAAAMPPSRGPPAGSSPPPRSSEGLRALLSLQDPYHHNYNNHHHTTGAKQACGPQWPSPLPSTPPPRASAAPATSPSYASYITCRSSSGSASNSNSNNSSSNNNLPRHESGCGNLKSLEEEDRGGRPLSEEAGPDWRAAGKDSSSDGGALAAGVDAELKAA